MPLRMFSNSVEPWAYVLCSTNVIVFASAISIFETTAVRIRRHARAHCLFLNEELSELPWYLLGTMVTAGSIYNPNWRTCKPNLSVNIHSIRLDYERRTSHLMHSYKDRLCSICVNSHRELAEVHGLYMYSRCRRYSTFSYFLGGHF